MATGGAARPSISVIIPTVDRGGRDVIEDALSAQTVLPLEVIWVHDVDRRGPAWARNRGVEHAAGEIVAFLDDDCVPPSQWLADLSGALVRHDAVGAGGTYVETDPFLAARRRRRPYPDHECLDTGGLVGTGGNVMYISSVLAECRSRDGWVFDERFRISQDKELAWRLRRHGNRLVFVPTPVTHTKSLSSMAYVRQQFGRGRGIAALDRLSKSAPSFVPPDRGMLWDGDTRFGYRRWLRALWNKGVGPFDVGTFPSVYQFALFWIGEKFQSLGYVSERLRSTYK